MFSLIFIQLDEIFILLLNFHLAPQNFISEKINETEKSNKSDKLFPKIYLHFPDSSIFDTFQFSQMVTMMKGLLSKVEIEKEKRFSDFLTHTIKRTLEKSENIKSQSRVTSSQFVVSFFIFSSNSLKKFLRFFQLIYATTS